MIGFSEFGVLFIDLMIVLEEQMEIVLVDIMDIVEGRCIDGVQVEFVEVVKEICSGNVLDGCFGVFKELCVVVVLVIFFGNDKFVCKDQVEGQGEVGVDRVEVE